MTALKISIAVKLMAYRELTGCGTIRCGMHLKEDVSFNILTEFQRGIQKNENELH